MMFEEVLKHLITDSTSRGQLASMMGSIYADVLINVVKLSGDPKQIATWDDIVKMACVELLEKNGDP